MWPFRYTKDELSEKIKDVTDVQHFCIDTSPLAQLVLNQIIQAKSIVLEESEKLFGWTYLIVNKETETSRFIYLFLVEEDHKIMQALTDNTKTVCELSESHGQKEDREDQ